MHCGLAPPRIRILRPNRTRLFALLGTLLVTGIVLGGCSDDLSRDDAKRLIEDSQQFADEFRAHMRVEQEHFGIEGECGAETQNRTLKNWQALERAGLLATNTQNSRCYSAVAEGVKDDTAAIRYVETSAWFNVDRYYVVPAGEAVVTEITGLAPNGDATEVTAEFSYRLDLTELARDVLPPDQVTALEQTNGVAQLRRYDEGWRVTGIFVKADP